MNTDRSVLKEFLQYPLQDGGDILRRFAQLPGAIFEQGAHPLARYVYVPGTRKDRVLLIAHCDTVWDRVYGRASAEQTLHEENGILTGECGDVGIGADDRAGCAMLWLLRDSGHSLLVLDGEEHGHFGANFICHKRKKLLRELNAHAYLLQLDLWGGDACMYHGIPNRRGFCRFIEGLGFHEENKKCGTDVSYLSESACGANISVGYYRYHRPTECLHIEQWEHVLEILRAALQNPQKRYRTRKTVRLWRKARITASLCYHRIRGR